MKKRISLVLILVLSISVLLIPARSFALTAGDVCAKAKMDTEKDTNRILWMGIGCLTGPIGVIVGYVATPSVPASRIVGKSSEYVAAYSDCYQSEGKGLQGMSALSGCGITVAINCLIIMLALL